MSTAIMPLKADAHSRLRFKKFVLVTFFFCIVVSKTLAQNFTSMTAGAPVTEASASRSVNWIDFDNDGLLDLFVTNGPRAGQNNFLYRNAGAPSFDFVKITNGSIVSDNGRSDGSSWGDYDNDGDLDAFVVNWYGDNNLFYENNGDGTFTQITTGPLVNDGGFSETCSWGDYDNDGHLDLYVSNSGDPNATGPRNNFLYRNNGNKTFTKITTGAIVTDRFYSRGVNWSDYDEDGDLDLFVANEENQANNLYRNMLKETGAADFTKITTGEIVTDRASSWSGSWGDYDNDGDFDLFVANWGNQNNALYRNEGGGAFTKVTTGVIVSDGGYSACTGWGDFDNDGDLDLYVTNAYGPAALTNFLYRNLLMESGSPTFEKITSGPATTESGFSYGFSWGDYDQDGDLDLFVARTLNENQRNALYRNDLNNDQRWLEVRCVGVASNKSALGARVRVKLTLNGSSIWQVREIAGQDGYCGQNLIAHFGLGSAAAIDSLRVEWPSGTIDVLTNVSTNQFMTISEGSHPTSVKHEPQAAPEGFKLNQNYPNPFNPSTRIEYQLPRLARVILSIHNLAGHEIRTLIDTVQPPGAYAVSWDGRNEHGEGVTTGIYFCKLTSGQAIQTRKMILVE